MMLLFPLPLGPVMTLKPFWNSSFTFPLKDLKFLNEIFLMYTIFFFPLRDESYRPLF